MTFLDALREVREETLQRATQEIPVQWTGGRVVVRFRPPPRDRLTKVIAAYRTVGALDEDVELQFIVDCCDEVLERNAETGDLDPADPPLRFDGSDERWGPDVSTARDCVRKLYRLDQYPLALAGIADALIDWLQGMDAAIAASIQEAGKAGNSASS